MDIAQILEQYGTVGALISTIIAFITIIFVVSIGAILKNQPIIAAHLESILKSAIKNINDKQDSERFLTEVGKSQIENLSKTIESCVEQINALRDETKNQSLLINDLQNAQKTNEEKIKTLTQVIGIFLKRDKDMRDKIRSLSKEKEVLLRQVENLTKQIEELKRKNELYEFERTRLLENMRNESEQ